MAKVKSDSRKVSFGKRKCGHAKNHITNTRQDQRRTKDRAGKTATKL